MTLPLLPTHFARTAARQALFELSSLGARGILRGGILTLNPTP